MTVSATADAPETEEGEDSEADEGGDGSDQLGGRMHGTSDGAAADGNCHIGMAIGAALESAAAPWLNSPVRQTERLRAGAGATLSPD
ncbi:hypothetical protein GCM10010350_01340 [Streptomyces galilaeus]|nr:hypothetical protein GCM10010350_01340 [Streptomyces galilaeus]